MRIRGQRSHAHKSHLCTQGRAKMKGGNEADLQPMSLLGALELQRGRGSLTQRQTARNKEREEKEKKSSNQLGG